MEPQSYNWTCSVCSLCWVLNALGNEEVDRYSAGVMLGYPECVNETYGCMSADCMVKAFAGYNLIARQKWCTFQEAYAISRVATGVINPVGMYHYMGIRGISGENIWLANSAQGYRGVYNSLSQHQFNSLGPVQLIYLEPYQ